MLFIFSSDVSISSLSFSQCNTAIECNGKSLHDITIDSCSFFNNSGGVSITSEATIVVKNCLFENNMIALSLTGTHNIVSKNVIVSNDYVLDVSGDNTEIVDNIIVRNSFGVRLQSAVNASIHRNQIANNVNRLNTTTRDGYGIQFDAITNNTIVYDNILEGNIIRDTGSELQKTGILIKRKAVNLVLENNIMSGHIDGDIKDISGVHS
jgi:parallel beta-helix repeat protein